MSDTKHGSDSAAGQIVRTYERKNGHMVHDGYFLLVPGIPLKWMNIADYSALQNAQ